METDSKEEMRQFINGTSNSQSIVSTVSLESDNVYQQWQRDNDIKPHVSIAT